MARVIEDLDSRDYQEELLETADEKNTILFLPTGSGKTYIAVMLIKKRLHEIQRNIEDGGKRTFFMVNTVPLVEQQAEYIRRFVPVEVGSYSGYMKVDYWTKEIWQEQLRKNQILVMTCQIFLDMLNHKYIELEQANLLIFDECHHAVESHPMRQVMQCFEGRDKQNLPRLLGLSATLLNTNIKLDKVKDSLLELERTFHSTVATVSDYSKVHNYSTNPLEHMAFFNEVDIMGKPEMSKVNDIIENAITYIDKSTFEVRNDMDFTVAFQHAEIAHIIQSNDKNWKKQLINSFVDLKSHINYLGIYGGVEAALVHTMQIKRWLRRAENESTRDTFNTLISLLTLIKESLLSLMETHTSWKDKIHTYSSPKVLKLFEMLKLFKTQCENVEKNNADLSNEDIFNVSKVKKQPLALIFVKKRTTSKILYKVLQALCKRDRDYKFMRPDFLVGFNVNPYKLTREAEFHNKLNSEVIKKFNANMINLLVTTDVLEEGVDIPQCTFVMKFDEPANYRSYVQSRGRARSKDSFYIMMCAEETKQKFGQKIYTYILIEKALNRELVGRSHLREEPEDDEIAAALYDSELPPYRTGEPGSPQVTLVGATSLVNRYCQQLPHDKFTKLTCIWGLDRECTRAFLQLPINSPVRDIIEGQRMTNRKQAKRAVALKACELLHKAGELDDHLLPRNLGLEEESTYTELFPYWDNETKEFGIPGTKNMLRSYNQKFPVSLNGCRPLEENVQAYVHLICMKPVYQCPNNNPGFQFYNTLNENQDYAILSSKPLPRLCSFPIYVTAGKIKVDVLANYLELTLTSTVINKIKQFHTMLFSRVVGVVHPFMTFNVDNEENSYLIVPTKKDDGIYNVDWNVINGFQTLPKLEEPSHNYKLTMTFHKEDYDKKIVIPWYRTQTQKQVYLVTRVCDDLSPRSKFPNETFPTYEFYYAATYEGLSVLHHNQPLLEVKGISPKIDCLRIRGRDRVKKYEEYLIPELCVKYTYPAVLWIKGICLPSILHRINNLLLAEEMRQSIVAETGIGVKNFPADLKLKPCGEDFEDEVVIDNNERDRQELISRLNDTVNRFYNISGLTFIDTFNDDDDKPPIDIDRAENPTDEEIYYYEDYVNRKVADETLKLPTHDTSGPYLLKLRDVRHKKINILNLKPDGVGPQQCDVLKALTSTGAHDLINLERSETLGDSFLKFAVSLFLFVNYPLLDEGKLSLIKGKLLGNRNLFYCGRHKGLGEVIQAQPFSPNTAWVPPSFKVNPLIKDILLDAEVSCSVLKKVTFSEEEQITGELNGATVDEVINQVFSAPDQAKPRPYFDRLLSTKRVPDKTVADSVESLVGVYLESSGIHGALAVLNWFGVLPKDSGSSKVLFDTPPETALLRPGDINMHLNNCENLEAILGYTFRDRSYLLQALTHPSYTPNRMTDCYQRLEYLGDAILDFLITCFIYENCGNLTPGQLTDLRSALVNNVTFASLAVRYGFTKHLQFSSYRLMEAMGKFLIFQNQNNHKICEEVLILMEERDIPIAEAIEVPKVFGDLFESIAAAIYLDSGKSLSAVWRVYYRLMKTEIDEFSKNIPKQSVRLLYELSPTKPVFSSGVITEDKKNVQVTLQVDVNGTIKEFHGIGINKKIAKLAASKIAVRSILKALGRSA